MHSREQMAHPRWEVFKAHRPRCTSRKLPSGATVWLRCRHFAPTSRNENNVVLPLPLEWLKLSYFRPSRIRLEVCLAAYFSDFLVWLNGWQASSAHLQFACRRQVWSGLLKREGCSRARPRSAGGINTLPSRKLMPHLLALARCSPPVSWKAAEIHFRPRNKRN